MRFLADESCDFAIVRALRAAGHDVLAVCEIVPAAEDADITKLALQGDRILITEDKDFGRLVYAHGHQTVGVILVRVRASVRSLLADLVLGLIRKYPDRLRGFFVVLQPGRVRISRTPAG